MQIWIPDVRAPGFAEEAHRQTEHGKQFAAVLDSICEAPPVFSDLKLVTSR